MVSGFIFLKYVFITVTFMEIRQSCFESIGVLEAKVFVCKKKSIQTEFSGFL